MLQRAGQAAPSGLPVRVGVQMRLVLVDDALHVGVLLRVGQLGQGAQPG